LSRQTLAFATAAALLCAALLGFAGRQLETPGLYYDEAVQAAPAAEFLRDGGRPLEIPGARNARLFGGWFPLMTQPYMSGLKSQLLIPSFALFGAGRASLRMTTLVWGCLGLVLCMLWVRTVWGTPAALLTGLLLASDPSFVFVTRHDWGSVSLALMCRGGGLWLLSSGWGVAAWRIALGACLLGLGVTNKIDAAAFLLGAGAALWLVAPAWLAREVRERPRHALLSIGGVLLGASPMLLALPGVWGATRGMLRSAASRSSQFAEKLDTWQALLDGSHFHRLMLTGGRFDALSNVPDAASGAFLWCFVAAFALLLVTVARDPGGRRREAFVLLATLLTAACLLAMPRAARIHHVMNVMPLPQLLVALAALQLWRLAPLGRIAAVAAVATAVAGHLHVDARTLDTLRESGGRGRWSGALERFAGELPAETVVVSLDWGFHAPLMLLRPELALEEPVWRLSSAAPAGPGATLRGTPRHVYLVQLPGYEVFEIGAALLEAVRELPQGVARIESVADASGAPAFHAVRFARPHTLSYRGSFDVTLR